VPDERRSPMQDPTPRAQNGDSPPGFAAASQTQPVSSEIKISPQGDVYTPAIAGGPLRKCEILSNLVQVRQTLATLAAQSGQEIEIITHPYALIVSQDCDLEQDFAVRSSITANTQTDKLLPNVMFCEVSTAESIYELTRPKGRDIWKRIWQNNDQRYHFLQKVQPYEDAQGMGLPELGIDFKRHFTLPTDEVYARLNLGTKRRCQLISPYLEHLASRFFHYLSRVALPADHVSE